jgi:hypothetical protein
MIPSSLLRRFPGTGHGRKNGAQEHHANRSFVRVHRTPENHWKISRALLPIPLHVWMAGGLAAAAKRAREDAEFQARAQGMEPGGRFGVLEQAGLDLCAAASRLSPSEKNRGLFDRI